MTAVKNSRVTGDTMQRLLSFVERYCQAYEALDAGALVRWFSGGETYSFGTGADEIFPGGSRDHMLKGLERDFSELAEASLTPSNINGFHTGGSLYVGFDLKVSYLLKGEQSADRQSMPGLRMSMVLEPSPNGSEEWLIAHFHLSAPLSAQPEGHSFPNS